MTFFTAPYCCFCISFDFDQPSGVDGFCKIKKERQLPMECCEEFYCTRVSDKDENIGTAKAFADDEITGTT